MKSSEPKEWAKIQVLLASYNGSPFISKQLDSIIAQEQVKVSVTIRDDDSKDSTISIIDSYCKQHRGANIRLIRNTGSVNGHRSNFSALCKEAEKGDHDYFCFSDQDDVWHQNKLSILKSRMQKLEQQYGSDMPILIHSDLCVVDEKLMPIAPSFIKYQGLPNPSEHNFPEFLYQNVVTGCSCFFNRALLEVASPLPESAAVHDWWFALCAQYFGVVDYVDKPLLDYRQHSSNSIGATAVEKQKSLFNFRFYLSLVRFPLQLKHAVVQAQTLLQRIEFLEGEKTKACYADIVFFSELLSLPFKLRLTALKRIFKSVQRWDKKLYLVLVLLFIRKTKTPQKKK